MAGILRSSTLVLKVTLLESYPAIWRRIRIPETFTFYRLHLAIQAAFGWQNAHLFQFGKNGLADENGIGIPNDDFPVTDARKVMLKKIFRKPQDLFVYVYDFGDHWSHIIELEAITNDAVYTAICEGGENECPPEDVGGIPGYQQMLEVFASGSKAEKRGYLDWLGLSPKENWNPHYYNQREVNKRMALISPENLTFG